MAVCSRNQLFFLYNRTPASIFNYNILITNKSVSYILSDFKEVFMKRYIYTILSQIFSFFLLLFLITPSSVSADVIFEPENSFYSRHSPECTYVNRNYTANGDITYRKSPDSPQAAGILKMEANLTFLLYIRTVPMWNGEFLRIQRQAG